MLQRPQQFSPRPAAGGIRLTDALNAENQPLQQRKTCDRDFHQPIPINIPEGVNRTIPGKISSLETLSCHSSMDWRKPVAATGARHTFNFRPAEVRLNLRRTLLPRAADDMIVRLTLIEPQPLSKSVSTEASDESAERRGMTRTPSCVLRGVTEASPDCSESEPDPGRSQGGADTVQSGPAVCEGPRGMRVWPVPGRWKSAAPLDVDPAIRVVCEVFLAVSCSFCLS